ncbi:MAG: class I SAM-dependent methyltransferase [Pseudomonadota bacterium]|nr:class I SAM-dependent methyltransferase [Pseudomonadota bacterium]
MSKVDLLSSLPRTKRDVSSRSKEKTQEVISESKKFGEMYFDGPRSHGYGGYKYDGRWISVATDIIEHYRLRSGSRILDVGCAKGFLVRDLVDQEMDAYGIDISEYAIRHCVEGLSDRLSQGCATELPYPDNSFDLVLSINTIHNLNRDKVIQALKEIGRVSRNYAFVQVDSYLTEGGKEFFEEWVLTAEYHDYPFGWQKTFRDAGYLGDYFWTILDE